MGPVIQKQDTVMRQCVTPEEGILIALRYLATGCTFTSLSFYFARGECTISRIIEETTQLMWGTLKEAYMPVPSIEEWKNIAGRYLELWNLPNCLGAMDGKHIRIENFPNSGSTNFNYKGYQSVILLGCCDADGLLKVVLKAETAMGDDGSTEKDLIFPVHRVCLMMIQEMSSHFILLLIMPFP
ncbi:hypothetical protein J437_LFUL011964 [Ladona fulva]|uniref:DDE Tnp4 domain-containing protein n=1 Tax=Ladona fulva TaxID=123851 RepID=A0A8K0P1F4_LADFU|nr:hypothetical protein J437_LFUL011964 [Ladona fulva]